MSKPSYTPQELAEEWGCSVRTIYRMIDRRALKAFKLGKIFRIRHDERLRVEGLKDFVTAGDR